MRTCNISATPPPTAVELTFQIVRSPSVSRNQSAAAISRSRRSSPMSFSSWSTGRLGTSTHLTRLTISPLLPRRPSLPVIEPYPAARRGNGGVSAALSVMARSSARQIRPAQRERHDEDVRYRRSGSVGTGPPHLLPPPAFESTLSWGSRWKHGGGGSFLWPARQDQLVQGAAYPLAPPGCPHEHIDQREGATGELGGHVVGQRRRQIPPPGGRRPEWHPGRVADQVAAAARRRQREAGLAALNPEPVSEHGRVIVPPVRRVGIHLGVELLDLSRVCGHCDAVQQPDRDVVGGHGPSWTDTARCKARSAAWLRSAGLKPAPSRANCSGPSPTRPRGPVGTSRRRAPLSHVSSAGDAPPLSGRLTSSPSSTSANRRTA